MHIGQGEIHHANSKFHARRKSLNKYVMRSLLRRKKHVLVDLPKIALGHSLILAIILGQR
jgi:hypothetical protein